MPGNIEHIFVLMLENRSFDHMLGFSGISGTDAVSGAPTAINGLTLAQTSLRQLARSCWTNTASGIIQKRGGKWPPPPAISVRALLSAGTTNTFNGQTFDVTQPADYAMPVDPGHEFPDVTVQLCGDGIKYASGQPYPSQRNSGFVASYSENGGQSNPAEVMKCYSPSQLPVLTALAKAFLVCDNWYSSLPGPTWPNRFFSHAASSGGLDHSPSTAEIAEWETVDGFSFVNGTIFDRLNAANKPWRIYAGDNFPIVGGLKGINPTEIHDYTNFAGDISQSSYVAAYTFIEPSYGHVVTDYKCGTSQHPLDDVTRGEMLIKCTYEAIRASPLWINSLLIITWDEHGGFYDHVFPPAAIAPGDTTLTNSNNQYGFTFEQSGVRVPAVVVSPLIPANLIDHRLYDHSSIPATIEANLGLNPMTQRDAHANNLMNLASLSVARSNTPATLPSPAISGVTGCDPVSCFSASASLQAPLAPSRPQDSINEGNLPGMMHSVLRWDLALSPAAQKNAIIARFKTLKTRADAWQYKTEVEQKIRATKATGAIAPPQRDP